LIIRLGELKKSVTLKMISLEHVDENILGCLLKIPEIVESKFVKGVNVYRNFGHTIGNLIQGVLFYECVKDEENPLVTISYRKPYPFDPSSEFEFGLDRDDTFPHALNPHIELYFAWSKQEKSEPQLFPVTPMSPVSPVSHLTHQTHLTPVTPLSPLSQFSLNYLHKIHEHLDVVVSYVKKLYDIVVAELEK